MVNVIHDAKVFLAIFVMTVILLCSLDLLWILACGLYQLLFCSLFCATFMKS